MSDRLFPDKLEIVSPNEVLKNYAHDFVDEIPASDSISGSNSIVTAIDSDGADVTATVVSGKNVSGTQLRANLSGFTDGKDYLIVYRAAMTTSGDAREKYTKVKCRQQSAVG